MTMHLFLSSEQSVADGVKIDDHHGLTRWQVDGRTSHRRLVADAFNAGHSAALIPIHHDSRALFFDMDATCIREESIDELAAEAGVGAEVASVTERAMKGQIDFRAALHDRVRLIKGLPLERVYAVSRRLTISNGLPEFLAAARARGIPAYLISGGFSLLAAELATRLGFSGWHANQLSVTLDGCLDGNLSGPIVDGLEKRAFVLRTLSTLNLKASQAVIIGDGANDLPMMQLGGLAFGFGPKPLLLSHLDAAAFGGNHEPLARFLWP